MRFYRIDRGESRGSYEQVFGSFLHANFHNQDTKKPQYILISFTPLKVKISCHCSYFVNFSDEKNIQTSIAN